MTEQKAAPLRAAGTIGLSSALFTLAAVAATLGALREEPILQAVAVLALAAFVGLEFLSIGRAQRSAALVLMGLALGIAVHLGAVWQIIYDGLLRTLPFLLIFAAVGWLRASAGQSPSVQALRDGLAELGQGYRFAALNVTSHVMGAGFNLAGMALLAPMLDDGRDDPKTGQRLRCAILWGFSSASTWSPFLVGTAAVLASMPQVTWLQTLPYGFLLAGGFLLGAFVYDRSTRGRRDRVGLSGRPRLAGPALRLLLVLALLFAITLGLIEGMGLRLTTAIALVAPSFGLGWLWLVHRSWSPLARTAVEVLRNYRSMRSETVLFVAANVFGAALSLELPELMEMTHLSDLSGLTGVRFVDILLSVWIYMAVCAAGLHPIVCLVVFTSAFDVTAFGLSLPVLCAAMMALWGMGTSVSPLSGTTLFMSQLSPVSSFTIAWKWNGPFYVLATFWVAAVLTMLG